MEGYLVWFVLFLPVFLGRSNEPSPGITQSKQESRNLDCVRMNQARAHELYPGRVPEPAPRQSSESIVDALICSSRYIDLDERPARDEALLSHLRRNVGELTDAASTLGTSKTTWHVDAFYPDARVAGKIAVTARTELAERGRKVSDRVPLLAAADLAVLHPLPPEKAFPIACKRYFAEKSLDTNDAFLAVTLVDPRETQLHAGVCLDGEWRWLQ